MTSVQHTVSANLMPELYFEFLRRLDLLEPLGRVPFHIQSCGNGFGSAARRCLALLACQGQGCSRLTDWTYGLRHDSRLCQMTRQKRPDGTERRRPLRATVPRVVVYHEDPARLPDGEQPQCFALPTTLPDQAYGLEKLLEAYWGRAGDVENIFSQLDAAFSLTHLRSRKFYGNYTFLLLTLIAANLTQRIREEALRQEWPIPAGLSETLTAAQDSGLRLEQHEQAACVLHETLPGPYTPTLKAMLRCSYQHRFRYVA